MAPEPNKPLVTAAELEALILDWGAVPHPGVDRFFPLRFWFLFAIAAFYTPDSRWLEIVSDWLKQE